MVFKRIAAVLFWLLVTLTSAFGFMASDLEIAPSDFFYETLDPVEQNDLGTRDTCWENGWLSYDTTSGYCVATNKVRPQDYGLKTIADDPVLHRAWEDSIKASVEEKKEEKKGSVHAF